MSRTRTWTFTVNNYTEDSEKVLQDLEVRYMLYGREVGEKGTPHLQGYVVFHNPQRFNQVKEMLPEGAHIESAKGNAQQNFDYCTKDGDYFEKGDRPKMGKRKDLEEIYHMAANQCCDLVIGEACPATYMKYYKAVDRVRLNYARESKFMDEDVEVIEVDGELADVLQRAYEIDDQPYWFQGTWWDGYQGQRTIVITNPDLMRQEYRLRYNFQLPIKGGYTWKQWTTIVLWKKDMQP